MSIVLIGAGGHAKAVVEILLLQGEKVTTYVDPQPVDWLQARHEKVDGVIEPTSGGIVIGMGGISPRDLQKRFTVFRRYLELGFSVRTVIHPTAYVSSRALLEKGVIALAGVVIQPNTVIAGGAIVNTGAIVEHDSVIGEGSHIGPGAIVLGECQIGKCVMIGAGAIVLPGVCANDYSLIAAGERCYGHRQEKAERNAV